MPEQPNNLRPEILIETAIKYKFMIILSFCVSLIVGMGLVFKLPRVYEASTTILVQPQKVPSNFVQSLISLDIEDRIRTLRQQILSWSNLEKIIEEYKLYKGSEYEAMLMEEKIEDLRRRIDLKVVKARGGADAFSIVFSGRDPETVMQVTNGLASYFINENLKVREEQVIGTSRFLDDELQVMRLQLVELENALKDFRHMNMGALPEQLQSNLSILGRMQEQLIERQKSLREARISAVLLEKQLSEASNEAALQSQMTNPGAVPPAGAVSADSNSLTQLKAQLESLRLRYTDQHPDVVRLREQIATLENDQNTKAGSEANLSRQAAAGSKLARDLAAERRMGIQLAQMKAEISAQEVEIKNIEARIDNYQKRVEQTPKIEQELYSLRRDYENIQKAYNSLLSRKLEAEISVNMEKKQKGEQFRMLDVARLPEKPVFPNVTKIFIISVMVGLAMGGGIIVLIVFLDSSVHAPDELAAIVGKSLVVAVPTIIGAKDLRRRRVGNIVAFMGIGSSAALLGFFALMAHLGLDRTIDLIHRYVN